MEAFLLSIYDTLRYKFFTYKSFPIVQFFNVRSLTYRSFAT